MSVSKPTSKTLNITRNEYGFPQKEKSELEKPADRFIEAEIRRRELVEQMEEREVEKYWKPYRSGAF